MSLLSVSSLAIISYLDVCCCRMAVVLYRGVMAGRFQTLFEGRRNFGRSLGLGGLRPSTRKGLGLSGHVWELLLCRFARVGLENLAQTKREALPIRTSARLKGTNPPERKKLQRGATAGRHERPFASLAAAPNPLFFPPCSPDAFTLSSSSPLRKTSTNRKHVDTERPVLRQEEDGHRRRPLQGSYRAITEYMACRPDQSLPLRDLEVPKFSIHDYVNIGMSKRWTTH